MANSYAQISVGGKNDKDTVKKAQQLLNEQINAGLAVDGIFGPKTYAAVKKYQKANQLQQDGIVGPKTWAALLGSVKEESPAPAPTKTEPAEAETESGEIADLSKAVAAAKQQYEDKKAQAPQPFRFSGQALLQQAEKDYLHRQPFSYDPGADPLYQQYQDQYVTAGRLAMEDTMGKAAALTGGYGNSYAQTAGQQVYQGYLQQLNQVLPELYELAYSKYRQQTDALKDRYDLLLDQRSEAYSQHQKEQDRYDSQLKALYQQYQDEEKRQNTAMKSLISLIEKGYMPTDGELASVGLTRRQANLLAQG